MFPIPTDSYRSENRDYSAEVAKLVDALVSGTSAGNGVEVRVLSSAHLFMELRISLLYVH